MSDKEGDKIHEIGIAKSGTGQVFPGEPAANASEADILRNKLMKCEIASIAESAKMDCLLDALEEKDYELLVAQRDLLEVVGAAKLYRQEKATVDEAVRAWAAGTNGTLSLTTLHQAEDALCAAVDSYLKGGI